MELCELEREAGLGGRALLPKQAIQKVTYTHEGMIDLMVSNPWISQGELAAHFGYSPSWVSQVIASDAFQMKMAERRDEIIDPAIKATMEERFKAIVLQSMEILKEKLSVPAHQVPNNLVLGTMEMASRALGYGARAGLESPPAAPSPDRLDILAGRLTTLLTQKREGVIIDAQDAEIVKG